MQRLLAGLAVIATCLALAAFHPAPAASLWRGGASAPPKESARSANLAAAGRRGGAPEAAAASFMHAQQPAPTSNRAAQAATASATGPAASHAEIRAFFDEYLRLHEQKDMAAWPKLFLDGATIVRTGSDTRVLRYSPGDLAARIAAEAAKLDSQHETFEDIRIEADGHAAMYSTHWKLFHNGALVREGRAWFSLVRDAGRWRIASLVWYNH